MVEQVVAAVELHCLLFVRERHRIRPLPTSSPSRRRRFLPFPFSMYPEESISPKVPDDRMIRDLPSLPLEENGFSNMISSLNSERAVHEFLEDLPTRALDEHLIEFSEALRTVAKALRRVAEGKASAQAEAAVWKRKYELEREQNFRLKQEATKMYYSGSREDKAENLKNKLLVDDLSPEKNEQCCGKDGICSHEILRDGTMDANSNSARKMVTRKASFRLAWGCNGDKSGQHKHEVVSFEKGNITTAGRSSKQILLKWESQPQTVLILAKPNSNSVRSLCAEMVRWLKDEKNINVFVEPRVKVELLTESSNFNFVQTWRDVAVLFSKAQPSHRLGCFQPSLQEIKYCCCQHPETLQPVLATFLTPE